jgi:two-component system response regulator AtoC
VRELENLLTRAAVLSQGDVLLEEHLAEATPRAAADSNGAPLPPAAEQRLPAGRLASLDEVEREHIARVYQHARGHKGDTCRILGISRPTLERKLRKYGLEK